MRRGKLRTKVTPNRLSVIGGISKTGTDVYDACQAVQIHDQIKSFENGYDTVVGSRRCSGGETQRVSNRYRVGGDIQTEN